MRVRDAVEADAEAMAAIADAPADVMRNIVHDRTVRVAERDAEATHKDPAATAESPGATDENPDATDPTADGNDVNSDDVVGFVSFDVRNDVVHVTQIDGTPEACERLLAEPVRFAETEGMRVELLVTDDEGDVATAAERAGFESDGAGPRFDGQQTVRYRLSPA
ncbi:hypothetical protein G9C85_17600 [Halorubellus sp. JP-L1]|uniref:hypothetical protein n=1 Tax=Halorubellus sp. JP-L1 TaxID=2715753 RepID=UPI00140ACAFC|nr:hypothetical protein [Halorubellus sp. JP-L1]NHN43436.1 hypothetical protein [Halorubellus sp. JP-L1]